MRCRPDPAGFLFELCNRALQRSFWVAIKSQPAGDKKDRFEITVDFGDACVETFVVEDEKIVE